MLKPVEVLIIDDNPGDIALLRESFKECAVQPKITAAYDADQAFDLLLDGKRFAPDLIILDVNLPRIDGFEILRRIRSDKRFSSTPVLVMSSSTCRSDVWRAYDLHANAFLTKPSDMDAYIEVARGIVTFWLEPLGGVRHHPIAMA